MGKEVCSSCRTYDAPILVKCYANDSISWWTPTVSMGSEFYVCIKCFKK